MERSKTKPITPKKSFSTDETLSAGICENHFFNILRGDSTNGHPETKMTFVPIKVNQRRVPISHIFTGEDPSEVKESQKKHVKSQVSSIMFNDNYIEKIFH